MRHTTEGALRRLEDEPFAVPDRAIDHLETCPRCQARMSRIGKDTERCARMLAVSASTAVSAPATSARSTAETPAVAACSTTALVAPDVDAAWLRFRRQSTWHPEAGEGRSRARHVPVSVTKRGPRLFGVSVRGGIIVGAVGVVLAGTAAAATITTVFAPTHVAPLPLNRSDLHALADFMGLGDSDALGGFSTSSGSLSTRFGRIDWSSSGSAQSVGTPAEASREAGFPVNLPGSIPNGVGKAQQFVVQPSVKVTATFDQSDQTVGGSSIVLTAGPAVLVEYGSAAGSSLFGSSSRSASGVAGANDSSASANGSGARNGGAGGLPTLGILTMPRPTAVSSGATASQIETYLLAQPGIPAPLAEEIRLLGDAGTTLPVPVPSDASAHSVEIGGSPGVLVGDPSNVVSGVIWEDGSGMLHIVAGLLDQQDVLNVANQLG